MGFDKTSLQRFERVLQVNVEQMTPDAARRAMAEQARKVNAEILAQQKARAGIEPGWRHAVDGIPNAAYETVRADGSILFTYQYLPEIALVGLQQLERNSPRESGEYAASHFLLINDQPGTADQIKEGDKIVLTNDVPYARRLEVGVTKSGRPFVMDVPPHIYERTQKELHRRYREVASIGFGYVDLKNAYVTRTANQEYYQTRQRRKRVGFGEFGNQEFLVRKRRWVAGVPIRYPAIFIEART